MGNPTLPVHLGEMQCRSLGASVMAFDEGGRPTMGEVGELVCTRPIPSKPIGFWNDPDGKRYLESYFETFVGKHGERIWRHGDWHGTTFQAQLQRQIGNARPAVK
jgi:acetoacetyl-CoA synthetase